MIHNGMSLSQMVQKQTKVALSSTNDWGAMRRISVAVLVVTLLAGCSSASEPEPAPIVERISAIDIDSMDTGIAWARGLDSNATADELSLGIEQIGDYFVDEDVWFATNNEIRGALISLNAKVQSGQGTTGAKVGELNVIVDDIEEAIEKGNAHNP